MTGAYTNSSYKVGDAMSDNAGFATAWTGDDELRTIDGLHRCSLGRIQA